MDLAKRYHDEDGNERNIFQMVNRCPEWAANRIQVGEAALEKWISVDERLPESEDNSVLVWFEDPGSIDMVHIQDYFDDITAGVDKDGNQLYSKRYISHGVTHWMPLPAPPKATP